MNFYLILRPRSVGMASSSSATLVTGMRKRYNITPTGGNITVQEKTMDRRGYQGGVERGVYGGDII